MEFSFSPLRRDDCILLVSSFILVLRVLTRFWAVHVEAEAFRDRNLIVLVSPRVCFELVVFCCVLATYRILIVEFYLKYFNI